MGESSSLRGESINIALLSVRIDFFPSGLAGAGQHRIISVQRRWVCISHLRVGKGYVCMCVSWPSSLKETDVKPR